jgi:hypothetical protein
MDSVSTCEAPTCLDYLARIGMENMPYILNESVNFQV